MVMISPPKNGYIVFGTDLFCTFHFEKVTEHFRGQFHFSACRPASMSPPPQWLSLFTQLQNSDRTAGWPTRAAQRPLRDLWLSSDHLHSTFSFVISCVCVCVCVYLHTHTAGLHSGRSNCHSMYFACGCVKLSLSLWPPGPHGTHVFCPFSCTKFSIIVSHNNAIQPPSTVYNNH